MSYVGDVLSKLVHWNVSQTGVWGRIPQPPVAHILHVFTAVWKNYIINIWKPIEKI